MGAHRHPRRPTSPRSSAGRPPPGCRPWRGRRAGRPTPCRRCAPSCGPCGTGAATPSSARPSATPSSAGPTSATGRRCARSREAVGLPAAELDAAIAEPAIKQELKERTAEAVDLGVRGAPTLSPPAASSTATTAWRRPPPRCGRRPERPAPPRAPPRRCTLPVTCQPRRRGEARSTVARGRRRLRRRGRRRDAAPRRLHRRHRPRARRARRRRLAPQHLSRRDLRHPVAPLRVLVRAQPALVAPLRAAGRDPGLPRGRRAALRRPRPHPHRHGGRVGRWDEERGRWVLETSAGPSRPTS